MKHRFGNIFEEIIQNAPLIKNSLCSTILCIQFEKKKEKQIQMQMNFRALCVMTHFTLFSEVWLTEYKWKSRLKFPFWFPKNLRFMRRKPNFLKASKIDPIPQIQKINIHGSLPIHPITTDKNGNPPSVFSLVVLNFSF